MKIKSLVRENSSLVPVEVEVTLLPGLPTIQFLGLPDQIIKESIHRIKSAIRQQGFDFPRAQQVFVNIRPNHLKKSSRGIELAVATGILWETGQLPSPLVQNHFFIYGELGLSGEVFEPEDLASDFEAGPETQVLTGSLSSVCCPFSRRVIHELKDLPQPRLHAPEMKTLVIERPQEGLEFRFSETHVEILSLAALGGHSLLLAGPSGSGKTTIAKTLGSLMSEPRPEEILEIKKIHKGLAEGESLWRPLINPHHSITPLALIGGGVPPQPGEISRAHRGLLVLDELLEFHPKVQESLREPMEEGALRLSRGTKAIKYPAMAQVVATTNLCPCGDFTPGCRAQCRFSLHKCKSYAQKLSGPLVDRFEILFFTTKRQRSAEETAISGWDLLEKLEKRREWLRKLGRGSVTNARRPISEIENEVDSFFLKHMMNKNFGSERRYQATLRVARTLADLEMSEYVQGPHIERALHMSWMPFEKLKRWD
ncbi:MAG TPA: ATP-binding protein [Pseudobdellovibrionaceae bacterium]|jgi:magnesium chelatase family protein